MEESRNACLVLANGRIFEGQGFGASGVVTGETVFTTGMNGYIETLTDPSYFGQIVTQTFPLIGNYGIIPQDFESGSVHVSGYIVRTNCEDPSNFRCAGDLDAFLKQQKVIGLRGIDTRELTKLLREAGVMNGMIISGNGSEAEKYRAMLSNPAEKTKLLEQIQAYRITNAVESVSTSARKVEQDAQTVFTESAAYRFVPVKADGTKVNDMEAAMRTERAKKSCSGTSVQRRTSGGNCSSGDCPSSSWMPRQGQTKYERKSPTDSCCQMARETPETTSGLSKNSKN